MLETSDPATVHAFFADRLGLHNSQDFRGVLYAPVREGTPIFPDDIAVAIAYNSFIGRTCAMHCVIQRPELFTKSMVIAAFAFPFNTCNCVSVLALVDSTNKASLRFDMHLGFKEIARIPNGGPEGDLIVLQMLREECRWLRLH